MPEAGFSFFFLRKLLLNFRDVCIFFGCDFLIFRFDFGQMLQFVVEGGDFGVVEFADEGHDIPGGIFVCCFIFDLCRRLSGRFCEIDRF